MRQVGKVLTVEELNQKIDKIEKIIDEIREKKSKLVYYKPDLPKKEIREIVLRKDVDLKAVDRQLEFSNAIKQLIEEGGMLKDLEEGLVDFRWRKGRKRAYLCWKYGEKEVKYWHGLKGGCKKRRPLK
jgi:hypothetical protein